MASSRARSDLGMGQLSRRDFMRLTAGSAAALALAACAPAASAPAAASAAIGPTSVSKSKTTLNYLIRKSSFLAAIDGRRATPSFEIQPHIYDTLLRYDEKGQLQPRLAESYEQLSPTSWRFKLRQGVKFHNGETFNAEGLKWALEDYAALKPAPSLVYYWFAGWPPTAVVESAYSVIINTPKPQPSTPRLFTGMSIIPPVAGKDPAFPDKPVGSGPFRIVQWDKGQKLVLEANPDYWDGVPKIKQLVITVAATEASAIAALQAGEVDVMLDFPYERQAEFAPKFNIIKGPTYGLAYLAWNPLATGPSKDARVRRAATYAIDTLGIRDSLFAGQGEILKGPFPSGIPGAVDVGGYPKRDVAAAKKMLADAGYPNGVDMTFISGPGGEFPKDLDVSDAAIAQAKEAGIRFRFEQMDAGALTERKKLATWDIVPNAVFNWVGDAPYYIGSLEKNNWKFPDLDKLIEQSNAQPDAQRLATVQEAVKGLWDAVPYLWAVGKGASIATVGNLKGAKYLPTNALLFDKAELV